MKITAINSNYEMKNSLKKNVAAQNTNMATPSFEGLNKVNKVSAKKLALALMAGIAVTTPALQSCATSKNVVNVYPSKKDTIDDFYINSQVTRKYPEINPEEHKSFDLIRDNWMNNVQYDTFGFNSPLRKLGDSLDAQLINYYVQNPEEKNLPNEAKIQEFVDNYNEISENGEEADITQAKQIIKQYKAVAQKYKITEQEAVWNLPSMNRLLYQSWVGTAQDEYYKQNKTFINPSSGNRKEIQAHTQKVLNKIVFEVEADDMVEKWGYMYSPKAIDEIHNRRINTEIHEVMGTMKSKGSNYNRYVGPKVELSEAEQAASEKAFLDNMAALKNNKKAKPVVKEVVAPAKTETVETPKAEVSTKKVETLVKETKTETAKTKEDVKVSEPDYKILYEVFKAQVEAEKAANDAKKANEIDYKAMYEDLQSQKANEPDYKAMFEDLQSQKANEPDYKAMFEDLQSQKANEPDYKTMYEELKAKMDAQSKKASKKSNEPNYKKMYEDLQNQKASELDYKALYENLQTQKSSEPDYKTMYEELKAQIDAQNKKASEVKKSNEPDYKTMYEELKAQMDAQKEAAAKEAEITPAPAPQKPVGKPIAESDLKAYGFTNRNIIKDCSILLKMEKEGYDISEYKEKLAGRISRISENDQAWVYRQPEYKIMFGN